MSDFKEILDTFENEDLKELAEEIIKTFPPYFYEVGASSTGKFHPSYALGILGLYRHTVALCKFLNHMFETEIFNFTSRERDLLRIAGITHDSRKSGTQEAYEKNKYTNFDHPLQAANVVRNLKNNKWNNDEIELIATTIESHMGKWNTDKRSSTVLPVPKDKYQKILHLADYLASRKDIEMKFDNEINFVGSVADTSPNRLMPFGKYAGRKISELDSDYLRWIVDISNCDDGIKQIAKNALKER